MSRHRNPRASVSKRPTPDNPGARTVHHEPNARSWRPEFEGHMNGLRLALGRAEALTDSLARYYDERHVGGADPDVAERRVSHLIDMVAVATVEATKELDLACETVGWEAADERP